MTTITQTNNNSSIKSFIEEALKGSFAKLPKIGEVVQGVVLGKESSTLYVDLGAFGMGVVYGREFNEAHDMIKGMDIGDVVSAKVVEPENEEGLMELSLKEASYEMAWSDIVKKKESGETIEVEIKDANKGGLIANLGGIMAFMPVSQLLTEHYPRVDGGDKSKIYQELMKFVGKKFKVKVIDVNQQENKLIISERGAQDSEIRKALEQYSVDDIVEGEISGIAEFGAFLKFKSKTEDESAREMEGLVHISELDWQLIENPSDVVKVGDKVQAKIISLDGDRISLSIKALKKDPWEGVEDKFSIGAVVKGTVTKVNHFGAFARLEGDIQGLCHVSEFGNEENMRNALQTGKEYEFNVQSISKQEHRMALGFGTAKKQNKLSAKEAVEGEGEMKEEK